MNGIKDIQFPDYFLTKEGVICHTLSELCEYTGKIIGFPKYFPVWSKDENIGSAIKIIDGREYYDHLPSFFESLEMMRKRHPEYLKFIPYFWEEICLFDKERDIIQVYKPRDVAKYIAVTKLKDVVLRDAQVLLKYLIWNLNIPLNDIGIEGSIMLNWHRDVSDIDLIIYGESSINKLKERFNTLSLASNIHLYNEQDIPLILSRRWKYRSFDSNMELLSQEQRRSLGLINGRRFWAQPVINTQLYEKKNKERYLVNIDIVDDSFLVVHANAYQWPSFYTLYNEVYWKIELECYDPIYMNQAEEGDTIKLRGKLYEDLKTNKKVIILWPWIYTHQYLRNILFIQ